MGQTIRSFDINGEQRSDTTYRTPIIAHYTGIPDRSFLDVGAADGYESRAVALNGAKHVLSIEAKDVPLQLARNAKELLGLQNQEVRQFDAREIDTLPPVDVTLCFGFLYHLQNPFNFLKRARRVTRDLLLLETHVAPVTFDGVAEKHRKAFAGDITTLYLDGVPFTGRFRPHQGSHKTSKGSVDAEWTFWLTADALLKAVMRAGFQVIDYHHEIDPLTPEVIRKWGGILQFGRGNTKVFIAARAATTAPGFDDPTISTAPDKIVSPSLPKRRWWR